MSDWTPAEIDRPPHVPWISPAFAHYRGSAVAETILILQAAFAIEGLRLKAIKISPDQWYSLCGWFPVPLREHMLYGVQLLVCDAP